MPIFGRYLRGCQLVAISNLAHNAGTPPDHSSQDERDMDEYLRERQAIRELPRRVGLGNVELVDIGSLFGPKEEWISMEDFLRGYL
jgi:hypothetical protein